MVVDSLARAHPAVDRGGRRDDKCNAEDPLRALLREYEVARQGTPTAAPIIPCRNSPHGSWPSPRTIPEARWRVPLWVGSSATAPAVLMLTPRLVADPR